MNVLAAAAIALTALVTIDWPHIEVPAGAHDRRLRGPRSVPAWWNARPSRGVPVSGVISRSGRTDHGRRRGRGLVPRGYAVGYVLLLALVAAPLRRSGAYTLPDFCEARLRSTGVRLIASALVVLIGWLYVLPQLQGAGLALHAVRRTRLAGRRARVGDRADRDRRWRHAQCDAGSRFPVLAQSRGHHASRALSARRVARDASPGAVSSSAPVFDDRTTVSVENHIAVTVDQPLVLEAAGTVDNQRVDGALTWQAGTHELAAGTDVDVPLRSARATSVVAAGAGRSGGVSRRRARSMRCIARSP